MQTLSDHVTYLRDMAPGPVVLNTTSVRMHSTYILINHARNH